MNVIILSQKYYHLSQWRVSGGLFTYSSFLPDFSHIPRYHREPEAWFTFHTRGGSSAGFTSPTRGAWRTVLHISLSHLPTTCRDHWLETSSSQWQCHHAGYTVTGCVISRVHCQTGSPVSYIYPQKDVLGRYKYNCDINRLRHWQTRNRIISVDRRIICIYTTFCLRTRVVSGAVVEVSDNNKVLNTP